MAPIRPLSGTPVRTKEKSSFTDKLTAISYMMTSHDDQRGDLLAPPEGDKERNGWLAGGFGGQGGRQGGCPDPVRSDRGLSWHFGPPVRSHLKWLSCTKNSSTPLFGTWKTPSNTKDGNFGHGGRFLKSQDRGGAF